MVFPFVISRVAHGWKVDGDISPLFFAQRLDASLPERLGFRGVVLPETDTEDVVIDLRDAAPAQAKILAAIFIEVVSVSSEGVS
jgi:hypothetical protein